MKMNALVSKTKIIRKIHRNLMLNPPTQTENILGKRDHSVFSEEVFE